MRKIPAQKKLKFISKSSWLKNFRLPKINFKLTFKEFSFSVIFKAVRRHFPLFLAAVFLAPALFLGYIFVTSRLYKKTPHAAAFTNIVRVSKKSTTLSTTGDWLKAMAFSGDGEKQSNE